MRKLTEQEIQGEILIEARYQFKCAVTEGRQFRDAAAPELTWEEAGEPIKQAFLEEAARTVRREEMVNS